MMGMVYLDVDSDAYQLVECFVFAPGPAHVSGGQPTRVTRI
jgi:hypothetical protein